MLKNIEPESRVEYLLEKQKKSNIEKNSICNTTLYDPYIKPSTVQNQHYQLWSIICTDSVKINHYQPWMIIYSMV